MGFIVDDIAVIATIAAALAAGGSMASLFSSGGDKTIKSYKLPNGTIRRVKLDGALKNIDPVGTVGHINTQGPDYGKAVDKHGELISSDNALERIGIGSYDAVKIASAMTSGISRMLNPRGADQIFKKTAKYGNMTDLTKTVIKDPDFMKKYMETLLRKGRYFDPDKLSPSKIVEILTNPANLAPIIQADPTKYKDVWEMINQKFPKYKIEPTIEEPWTKTTTGAGDEPQPDKPDTDKPKPVPKKPDKPKPKPPEEPPEGPKRPEGDKRDPPDKPDEPDDEKEKPKPLPTPQEVKEREIQREAKQKPKRQPIPKQWYPEYSFGGQNLLKLTDLEKLEELKNYSLFDLVNPLLEGDRNNLLAIQNRLKEKMRFSNTYANPRPEPQLPPPPASFDSSYQMRDVMPVSYPFSLDQPHANNYYDRYAFEYSTESNKNIDAVKRDHTFEPEISKILNGPRRGYTATDSQIMKHEGAKSSLLEGLDSTAIDQLDLMMLR